MTRRRKGKPKPNERDLEAALRQREAEAAREENIAQANARAAGYRALDAYMEALELLARGTADILSGKAKGKRAPKLALPRGSIRPSPAGAKALAQTVALLGRPAPGSLPSHARASDPEATAAALLGDEQAAAPPAGATQDRAVWG